MVNQAASGNPALLVDEQAIVADPDFGKGGLPTTNWNAGFSAGSYPASAYLDLGLRRKLTKIYLHDYSSSGYFTIDTGKPGAWRQLARDGLRRFASWAGFVPTERSQFVRFTMESSSSNVAEVAIYAKNYNGYADWAEQSLPASARSPDSDADLDGMTNLLEYAIGGDPTASEAALAPSAQKTADNLVLTYTKDLWLTDVLYIVEWSTDLKTWQSSGITQVTELATNDFARIRCSLPIASSTKAFMRLRIEPVSGL
jgi:hypothetical protein